MQRLTLRELNRATLARQLLLERHAIGVVEAIERLGGMQAQEPKHPFVGLWSRLAEFEREDLLRALRKRAVLRGILMRGTLHLASAPDVAAWQHAQPGAENAVRYLRDRAAGLDIEQTLAAARDLLAAGPLRFGAIRAALQERFPDVNERALGYVVRMQLPLAMEPSDDRWGFPRDAPFGLLDAPPPDGDAAALVRRYLAAFGPATPADFQTWSGLKGARPVFEGLALERFKDERGRTLFDLPDAPRPGTDVPAPVRLLPEFDSLMLAHDDRTRVLADEHRPRVVTKNLRIRATYLLDGFAAGTWTVEASRNGATLVLEPFAPGGARSRELQAEGEALLRFLEPDAPSYAVRYSE